MARISGRTRDVLRRICQRPRKTLSASGSRDSTLVFASQAMISPFSKSEVLITC